MIPANSGVALLGDGFVDCIETDRCVAWIPLVTRSHPNGNFATVSSPEPA